MEIPEIAATVVMALGLTYLSVEDLRSKNVSLWVIMAMGLLLLGISVWQKNGVVFILLGIIPGLTAVIFSYLTAGGLGMGDAVLLMSLGVYLGIWTGLTVLMLGLFLSSIAGIVLLILKKARMKTEMPFIPFYLGGFLLWEVGRWVF